MIFTHRQSHKFCSFSWCFSHQPTGPLEIIWFNSRYMELDKSKAEGWWQKRKKLFIRIPTGNSSKSEFSNKHWRKQMSLYINICTNHYQLILKPIWLWNSLLTQGEHWNPRGATTRPPPCKDHRAHKPATPSPCSRGRNHDTERENTGAPSPSFPGCCALWEPICLLHTKGLDNPQSIK